MLKKFFGEVKTLGLNEKLLLALVFILPFERIPSLEVRGLTLKLSLVIGLILIIVSSFNTLKNLDVKKHKVNIPSFTPALFLLYSLITYLWVVDSSAWLKSNLILGFVLILFYEVWRVTKQSKDSKRLIDLIVKALFLSTLVVISFGFYQWLGDLIGLPTSLTGIRDEYTAIRLGLPRMHSVLLEPLYFSLFLLLPLGISLADIKNRYFKNLGYRLGFIVLIYVSILLSLARGAIAASAVMGLIAICLNYKEIRNQLNPKLLLRYTSILIVFLIIILVGVSLLGKKGTDQDNNYSRGVGTLIGHLETIRPWGNSKDKADDNSINSRDVARGKVWDVITDSPKNFLLGVGAGQYGAKTNSGYNETSNFVILDVWVQYGLIGLSILAIFVASLVIKVNYKNTILLGIVLYLVGYLIQSITFGELEIVHLWVALAILASQIEAYQ